MSTALNRIFALTLLLAAAVQVPGAAAQATAEAQRPRAAEYMIYQYSGVALVVIVDAFESEFAARITGPEGGLLTEAAVAGRRIGPVYLYVDSTDRPRQLMVHVRPGRPLGRDAIGMELMQLSMADPNARRQAQAYRLLANGMQPAYADDASNWVQRREALSGAARAFAGFGMEKMRLWSEYYAALLGLQRLDDVRATLQISGQIRAAADRAGFETVGLASRILQADALLRGAEMSPSDRAAEYYGRAHAALAEVADAAGALGYPGEQGRALLLDGEARERQGDLERAIERYEQALDVSVRADDVELRNRIRATAAAAYERQGRTSGAIGLLEAIAGDLPATPSADAERAAALYEKGRLLNRSYRYREAAVELAESLRLQQGDPAVSQWGGTGLELGWALYAMGDLEQARRVLIESLPRTAGVEPWQLARGYGALAHMARFLGRFEEMRRYRGLQAALPGVAPADQAFEQALDAVAEQGAGSAGAVRGFERAFAAAGPGAARLANQAALYLCLHRLRSGGACDAAAARAAWEAAAASGLPRAVADARLVYAQTLRIRGEAAAAARELAELLAELRSYRVQLPGVLGAWDWSRAPDVYREHLALALERSQGAPGDDGSGVLLALEQVRSLELAVATDALQESLRNQVADLEQGRSGPGAATAQRVAAGIRALAAAEPAAGALPDRAFVDAMLGLLERRETLLAWHLADSGAWLLAANRRGVRLHAIGPTDRLQAELRALREASSRGATDRLEVRLERLGRTLFGPVANSLDGRIYVLAQGDLNGVPLDALRLDGRFLAERGDLVRLASLEALQRRRPALRAGFERDVFVAGNPQAGRDPFSYEVERSLEIDAVRDRFVGPGLHVIQGVALDREEFLDARFSAAALLHLALPGRIELFDADRSRLLVSGPGDAGPAGFLSAGELRGFTLAADLAVLSATAVDGAPRSVFDGRLGLVSDLHEAGVGAVVASLWPAGDALNAELMDDFYARLEADGDIVAAFGAARRGRLDPGNPGNLLPWAGFQLFIR